MTRYFLLLAAIAFQPDYVASIKPNNDVVPSERTEYQAGGRFTAAVAVGRGNQAHIHAACFGGACSLDFRLGSTARSFACVVSEFRLLRRETRVCVALVKAPGMGPNGWFSSSVSSIGERLSLIRPGAHVVNGTRHSFLARSCGDDRQDVWTDNAVKFKIAHQLLFQVKNSGRH